MMTSTTPHTCPDIGDWRAWLDREPEAADLGQHLGNCVACQALVADLHDAATHAETSLAMLATSVPDAGETAVARERFERRRRTGTPIAAMETEREPTPISRWPRIPTGWRIAGSGIAAAIALTLVVSLTPQGQTTAAAFLAQFRSQQVAAIEITPQTQAAITRTMQTLSNLGTLQTPAGLANGQRPEAAARSLADQSQTVSIAEASQTVKFPVQTPDPASLPPGFDKTPTVRVSPATQMRFTFDKNKARSYFQSTGHPEVSLPDKFDGASLVVSIPSAALLQYANPSSKDALIVAQAGELVVDAEGNVSLDEMRDFLLSLPGLPQSTVNQLKQIKNWNQTLPVPVPVDVATWKPTTIKGNQALLLNDNSGVGSAAIWHENGHLVGAAGSLKANDLTRIVETLKAR
jgi:hypothetical protein